MYKTGEFSGYGCCVEEVFDLAQYESQYYSAPQVTTSGSTLPEFVYNSVAYVQPNPELLYPVMSVVHGGTTYFSYPECVLIPVYYCVPVVLAYQDPVVYENSYNACNDHPEEEEPLCHRAPSDAVTSLEIFYEEEGEYLNDAPFNCEDNKNNDDDKKNNDNNGSSCLEEKKSMCPDCANESSAYKKFSIEMEERRKIVGESSQVQKTFVNRGVVADPSEYRKFCDSVEDRIKKFSESCPDKKTTKNRSAVQSSHRKFWSDVEERRKTLNSSSVRQKTYVNRGIVADSSSYREFCRTVEEGIKKQGSIKTSPSSVARKFVAKESSKGDGFVQKENDQTFMHKILNSREYLDVQDNIENPKKYRDVLYRQALNNNPRRSKAALFDILPVIIEEPFIFDDVTAKISCGDSTEIEPPELVSDDKITKPEQPKGRLKTFRKWLSRKFCCCFTNKDPP